MKDMNFECKVSQETSLNKEKAVLVEQSWSLEFNDDAYIVW